MAREKKERKPIIIEPVFNSYQAAVDMRDKAQKKVNRIKIGLLIALVAELLWVATFMIHPTNDFMIVLSDISIVGALITTIAAYIIGGGLGIALRTSWKISTTIGWIGWFVVPFPMDIFTGIFLTIMGIVMLPLLLFFVPIVFVLINLRQNSVDLKAAETYLKYCEVPTSQEV